MANNQVWNDKNLQKLFDELDPATQAKLHRDSMRIASREVAKQVKANARSAGLAWRGPVSKNGWDWYRYGRVFNSIVGGKVWTKGATVGGRVYSQRAKSKGFLNRAPHAHLVIAGHTKYIPTRAGSLKHVGRQPPHPIYDAARPKAISILTNTLEKAVTAMIRRLNRKYG